MWVGLGLDRDDTREGMSLPSNRECGRHHAFPRISSRATDVIWNSKLSTKTHAVEAATEAASQALEGFEGVEPDIAFVFIGGHSARESEVAIDTIRQLTRARHLLGCTAGGVLGGGREVEQRASIALTLA